MASTPTWACRRVRTKTAYPHAIRNLQSAIARVRNPQSAIEECRGGSDWLDERATEALLSRAGVLCDNPQYPVYEKQTFAYDGWRVIQEHKKTDGNGIPMATAIPVARQFTYGNYLDEALTVDADTDSDGDCIDSGGSTRYYYHQNSLFSVVALSDTSANYKEGYQYDPYGRHVRLTDGNDGDTYVNFNTNDARSAGATSAYGNPYMFTGQRLDSESGLYYYKNRYYSTTQGRFISRDPIGYLGGYNLYEYVRGAATFYTDPEGLRIDPITGMQMCNWCWHEMPCPYHPSQSFPPPPLPPYGPQPPNGLGPLEFVCCFLLGALPKEVSFGPRDPMTEGLKQSPFIAKERQAVIDTIIANCQSCNQESVVHTADYSADAYSTPAADLKAVFGSRIDSRSVQAILGTYRLVITAISIDCCKGNATLAFNEIG